MANPAFYLGRPLNLFQMRAGPWGFTRAALGKRSLGPCSCFSGFPSWDGLWAEGSLPALLVLGKAVSLLPSVPSSVSPCRAVGFPWPLGF